MPHSASQIAVLHAAALPIAAHLRAVSPRLLTHKSVLAVIREQLPGWAREPATGITPTALLDLLLENGSVQKIELRSKEYPLILRYASGPVAPLVIASSIRPKGYLSHGSAAFLHGLNDERPKAFYINVEQSAKPKPRGAITQESVTRAFSNAQRTSRYVFFHDKIHYVILSGKHTDDFGVIDLEDPGGVTLRTTDLERTLIDIVVRPGYAGGIHAVRRAFEKSKERVSIPRLTRTLQALDHAYPYHQALGLLLERAGLPLADLAPLRNLGLDLDFYLAHGLKRPVLDASWRIYHPKDF